MTDTTPEIRALAATINDLQRQVRALSRGSGAAFRSVELGDGQPKYYEPTSPTPISEVIIEDGQAVVKPVQPPPPPVPTQPIVESAVDGINVKWDGTFIGANRPTNLRYIEIHASFDPNFEPSDSTQVGSMVSAFGGTVFIRRPPEDGPVWVGLTAVDVINQESEMSSTAEGEPLAVGLPEPVEPTDAPDVVLASLGVGGVLAAWDPVGDAETYEVYVSTQPIVAFDPYEFLGEGPATSVAIGQMPDGNVLPYVPIYVRVRAKSAAGIGPASPNQSVTPKKATTADVAAEYVYAGLVSATQVTSGSLNAVMALLGSLTVGSAGGRSIVLNPTGGLQVIDENNEILVSFPTEAGTPNVFSGDGVFQGITALGRASFRGNDNEISRNSSFTLASGTTKPSNAPILEMLPGQLFNVNPGNYFAPWGSIAESGWAEGGDYVYGLVNNGDFGGGEPGDFFGLANRYISKWHWKNGQAGTVTNISLPANSHGNLRTRFVFWEAIARVGNLNVYIYWYYPPYAETSTEPVPYSRQGFYFQCFDDAGTLVGGPIRAQHWMNPTWQTSGIGQPSDNNSIKKLAPVASADGAGNICLVYKNWSTGKLVKYVQALGGSALTSVTSAQTYPADFHPLGNWGIKNFDRGSARLALGFKEGVSGRHLVRFFNPTTMAEYTPEATDFNSYGGTPLLWDATDSRFWNTSDGTQSGAQLGQQALVSLVKFSKNATEDYAWVGYSWYDDDPGGTGLHETTLSPYAYILRKKYWVMAFKTPVAPADAGDVDSPNTSRFYMVTGTAEPVSELAFRLISPIVTASGPYGSKAITLDYLFNTTPPPALNTFPDGNSAILKSGIGGFIVRGDGTGAWPALLGSDATQAAPGNHNHDARYVSLTDPCFAATLYKVQPLLPGSWYNIDYWSPSILHPDVVMSGGSEGRTTFSIKRAGIYDIRFVAMFRNSISSAGSRGTGIFVNGGQRTNTLSPPIAGQADYASSSTNWLIPLNVNDYIHFRVLQTTAGTVEIEPSYTQCTIMRVRN